MITLKSGSAQVKKIFVSCFLLISFFQANAQNPVLNSGFENWTYYSNPPYADRPEPDFWTTYNGFTSGNYTVIPDSPGYQGNYGIKLQVVNIPFVGTIPGFASSGCLVSFRPNYVSAQVKYQVIGGDSIHIRVFVFQSGNIIGSAVWAPSTGSSVNYIPVSAPFNYSNGSVPDSVYITLEGGNPSGSPLPQVGTFLVVDNLVLTDSLTSVYSIGANPKIDFFPNPSVNYINVRLHDHTIKNCQMTIWNGIGEKIVSIKQNEGDKEIQVDLSKYPAGNYFLEIVSDDKLIRRIPFVKVR